MDRKPQHPVNGEYPVVVAVNPMTGSWEEFCLREIPEFPGWSADMTQRGWVLLDRTLDEVLAVIDQNPTDTTGN